LRVGGSEGDSGKKSHSESSSDKKSEEKGGRGSESDSVMTGGSGNFPMHQPSSGNENLFPQANYFPVQMPADDFIFEEKLG
jgi:hypothetical protein